MQATETITDASLVDDVVTRFPTPARVFVGRRMHCVGCEVSRFETLAGAARIYRQPLEPLLADLHAAAGPGGGAKVTQVTPGEDGSFRFQALNPGVYIYHCATPMVAQHIASGMYGMIVVQPKAGLPKVDHKYYLMEGDFYLQGNRGDAGLRAFDLNKMLDERPDYVLFNGGVGSLTGDNAFKAGVGETIRLMVPGVEQVQVNLVVDPRWTPERMSAAAKQRLGFK